MSVDCRELLASLYAFLDGELDETLCGRIRVHLDGCGRCRDNAEFETAFKAFVARSCCDEPPAGFFDRVKAVLDTDS
jgi:mycothiol system anti-sigma-R factor